ncbi:hypothetical protein TWF718_002261 [Orbilia javanica]|uniref:Uncharacterized protein n=1 Tax=Orbilia javanica TaxID=47235 RepID=A0AAN8MTW8_9PEZI
MLIGRPLLRRCCSPSSKLPDTPQRFPTTNHLNFAIIAIVRQEYRHPVGVGSGSRIYSHWGVGRAFSTDSGAGGGRGGGYQDGVRGRYILSKPHAAGSSVQSGRGPSPSPPPLPSKEQNAKVNVPPELSEDFTNSVVDDPADDFEDLDDLDEPGPDSRLSNNRNRQADEEFFAILDNQRRQRASQNKDTVRGAGPSRKTLEDTSRFLLSELLAKEHAGKKGYKKGDITSENEADLALLQKTLDVSVTKIQNNAKPGYHPLPFYLHQNSKTLDEALKVVLQAKQPDVVNKVCYNLLISDSAPTINTFNILLRRFTKLRMTALARVILSTLFAVGFEPNAYTYAAILQYLTVTQNYAAFNRAVQIMRDTFIDFKNPILGAAELNGWSKLGNFMGMRRRLRLLQEEGLRDDIYVLAIELRYFAKRHMWEGGLPALMLLLKKEAKDIDHRALFWAFRLCVNCHQHEFADRLKAVVQEKRWPLESLWTRPVRTRGLPYGYKGNESGQLVPKGTDPPQWTDLWNSGGNSKGQWQLRKPNIRSVARVPEVWREYSSALWERANGKHGGVDMKRWRGAVPGDGGDSPTDIGVRETNANHQGITVEDELFEPSELESSARDVEGEDKFKEIWGSSPTAAKASNVLEKMPERSFKTLKEGNVWKSLLKKRKRELLRPETRGPKPR